MKRFFRVFFNDKKSVDMDGGGKSNVAGGVEQAGHNLSQFIAELGRKRLWKQCDVIVGI